MCVCTFRSFGLNMAQQAVRNSCSSTLHQSLRWSIDSSAFNSVEAIRRVHSLCCWKTFIPRTQCRTSVKRTLPGLSAQICSSIVFHNTQRLHVEPSFCHTHTHVRAIFFVIVVSQKGIHFIILFQNCSMSQQHRRCCPFVNVSLYHLLVMYSEIVRFRPVLISLDAIAVCQLRVRRKLCAKMPWCNALLLFTWKDQKLLVKCFNSWVHTSYTYIVWCEVGALLHLNCVFSWQEVLKGTLRPSTTTKYALQFTLFANNKLRQIKRTV